MQQRVPFNTLFNVHPEDNTIEPLRTIRIGGVTMSPGFRITSGSVVGGIVLSQYVGHDLNITIDNEVAIILGIF